MLILRHYENPPAEARGGVVLLGNFDGVHRGHQAVIGKAGVIAAERGAPLVVVTFEPHPRSFFRPHDPPYRLAPFRTKARQIAALGVDVLVVVHFTEALSRLCAADFARALLVDGLGVSHVVIGYDFRFGHKRGGNGDLLRRMGKEAGFDVTVVAPVASADQDVYASTHIRELLVAGKPGHAAAMLGRPFEVEGRVQHGDQRGRQLGFPTANVALGEYLRPAAGVYAVRVGVEGETGRLDWYDGVANLGRRPTVDGLTELLECHLFGFAGDLYGRNIRVALIEFLRPEQKFPDLDALRSQIAADSEAARRILRIRAAGAP